jgi:squalene-hopene/tetraprenyl-beta-curcumene cyclase
MLNSRTLLITLFAAATLSAADWDPAAAARYLDGRQQEWFEWKRASTADGTCVSCHTGMTYLLARPALRKALNEPKPTDWELKLLSRLRTRAGDERKGNLQSVQTIFGAMFIGHEKTEAAAAAHLQLRDLEVKEGPLTGVWPWYDAKLDPWESQSAISYGAALAASSGLADTPQTVAWLRTHKSEMTLHSRLTMLWAADKAPGLLTKQERSELVAEVIRKQRADGSWSIQSLGPWMPHPDAPAQPAGGHPYATGFAAWVLRQSAAPEAKASVAAAQNWLKANQDRASGAWFAPSMNKKFPEGSMESKFMQDAATAFAVLALLD